MAYSIYWIWLDVGVEFCWIVYYRMTGEVANEGEKNLNVEKPSTEEEAGDDKKENLVAEAEDKEPEDKVKSSLSYTTQY